ncbi:MAG: ABC transporter permease [Lachnospiraceae bacterium]|nr:ABC transporter permease [Lachnospiraceae bacterium]
MKKYILKRVLDSLFTILIIATIVFLLMRLLPTDYYFTDDELLKLTVEQRDDILMAAGLKDPIIIQLGRFYVNLLHLDLGSSLRLQSGVAVTKVIGSRFTMSMRLGLIAFAISLVLGVTLGVIQAAFKNRIPDHIGTAYTVFANAVPQLVLYSLILLFGARVLKLPSMYSSRQPIRSSILPVVCLVLSSLSSQMLLTRRYMVDELNKDYIRLAKIKGASNSKIMFSHVLRNAFVPLAQNIPGAVLGTIAGSLLVERFFSVPGMGALLTDAIGNYDTNVVQALVILYAFLGTMGVLLGDLFMMFLDPRIKIVGEEGTR